jgi:hypothetical protein
VGVGYQRSKTFVLEYCKIVHVLYLKPCGGTNVEFQPFLTLSLHGEWSISNPDPSIRGETTAFARE